MGDKIIPDRRILVWNRVIPICRSRNWSTTPMAVFHNLTMGREGHPTIQISQFNLTPPPPWEGLGYKWTRQGDLSDFSQFWTGESRSRGLGMYENQKNIPAFQTTGKLNKTWIYLENSYSLLPPISEATWRSLAIPISWANSGQLWMHFLYQESCTGMPFQSRSQMNRLMSSSIATLSFPELDPTHIFVYSIHL